MNSRFSIATAALGCVLLASCYPYDESRDRNKLSQKPPQKTVTTAEQQKLQEQRDKTKAEADEKKKEEVKDPTAENPGPAPEPGPGNVTPPKEEKRNEFPVANKVPGKDGYVFSPYNNKLVDVRDIPSGTLVQDPTYTGAGKGYFRVP